MWGNSTPFHRAISVQKNVEKKYYHELRKSFFIDLLTANNAIWHDSLI